MKDDSLLFGWWLPKRCLSCGAIVTSIIEERRHLGHKMEHVAVVEWLEIGTYTEGHPFVEEWEWRRYLAHVGCGGKLKMVISPHGYEVICEKCGLVGIGKKISGTLVEQYLKAISPHRGIWNYQQIDAETIKWELAKRIEKAGIGKMVKEERLVRKRLVGNLRLVRATKEWECKLCGKPIQKGEKHYVITYPDVTTYTRRPGRWSMKRYGYHPIWVTRRTTRRCRAHVDCVKTWRKIEVIKHDLE